MTDLTIDDGECKGNHPQMALIQASEILQFTQIIIFPLRGDYYRDPELASFSWRDGERVARPLQHMQMLGALRGAWDGWLL